MYIKTSCLHNILFLLTGKYNLDSYFGSNILQCFSKVLAFRYLYPAKKRST